MQEETRIPLRPAGPKPSKPGFNFRRPPDELPNHRTVEQPVDVDKTHDLFSFLFGKCFIDRERAEMILNQAHNIGVFNAQSLKKEALRDDLVLEKIGMTSVDIMLTLRALENL